MTTEQEDRELAVHAMTGNATGGVVSAGHTVILGEHGCGLTLPSAPVRGQPYLIGEFGPEELRVDLIDVPSRPLRTTVHAHAERLDRPREIGPAVHDEHA